MKAAEILQTFNSYSSFVKHGLTPKESINQGMTFKPKVSPFNRKKDSSQTKQDKGNIGNKKAPDTYKKYLSPALSNPNLC